MGLDPEALEAKPTRLVRQWVAYSNAWAGYQAWKLSQGSK